MTTRAERRQAEREEEQRESADSRMRRRNLHMVSTLKKLGYIR